MVTALIITGVAVVLLFICYIAVCVLVEGRAAAEVEREVAEYYQDKPPLFGATSGETGTELLDRYERVMGTAGGTQS